jgi:hypothetical protein
MDPAVVHYYDGVLKWEGLHMIQEPPNKFREAGSVESAFNDVTIDHSVGQRKSWKYRISRGKCEKPYQ